jgi:hypothetical protein
MAKASNAINPTLTAAGGTTGAQVDTASPTSIDTQVDTAVVAPAAAAAPAVPVKARVLTYCAYGKPDDVIKLDPALLDSLTGVVDATPAAVAYAESLAQ